jgi:hypothetical protein
MGVDNRSLGVANMAVEVAETRDESSPLVSKQRHFDPLGLERSY